MIKINLLPQDSKRSGGGAPHAGGGLLTVVAAVVLMGALNGLAGWTALRSVLAAKQEVNAVQEKYDLVKKQIEDNMTQAEQVRKYREVVNNQMDVLKSLDPPDRILWCEKLNMLSNLIPTDVFISEMNLTEQVEMVETEASKAAHLKWEKTDKKQGKEPLPVKRPIISYQLKLTGLALGKDNVEQFDNVMKFHKALSTHTFKDDKGKTHRFMDGFNDNIDFGSLEATLYEGTPVNQFVFTLRTKVMGVEELKKPVDDPPQVAAAAPARASVSSRRKTMQEAME